MSTSRATWVDQMLVDDVPIFKVKHELGPGSYSPEPIKGNLSTINYDRLWTTLPEKRKPYGLHFKLPYEKYGYPRDPPKTTGSLNIGGRRKNSVNWTEFSPHQQMIDAMYHDGKLRTIKGKIFACGEDRFQVKMALPDYDINYDSLQIRSKTPNGRFPILKRPEVFPVIDTYEPPIEGIEDRPWRNEPSFSSNLDMSASKHRKSKPSISQFHTMKTCDKPKGPLKDVNPFEINRSIKANMFYRGHSHALLPK